MKGRFDERRHRRRTEIILFAVAFGLMAALGGGLAWWQLGVGPAVCAVVSVGGGVALFGGLWLLFTGIERWTSTE